MNSCGFGLKCKENRCELIEPSVEYKASFIEAVKEFQADADYTHRNKRYRGLSIPQLETDFDSFIERALDGAKEENIPDELVPETTYWLVDAGEFGGWGMRLGAKVSLF